jgi:hypothetical protein
MKPQTLAPPKPANLLPKKLFPMKRGQLSTLMMTPLSARKFLSPFSFWDFYFRALGSLVVLSFPQLLSFSSVFPKTLSETITDAVTAGCPTVDRYLLTSGAT